MAYYGHEKIMPFMVDQYIVFNLSIDPVDEAGFSPLLYGKRVHMVIYSLLPLF